MCGILGLIGPSKDPAVSHELMTSLLLKTETRGDDATGFWATEFSQNTVFYSKRPDKAAKFVQENELWKGLKEHNIDLMVAHCRKRTYHNGIETVNKNNHPFVSPDVMTALVHNGNVPEFDMLKKGYSVKSDCDSEILLRMIQTGDFYDQEYLRQELSKLKLKQNEHETRTIQDLDAEEQIPFWAPRLLGLRDVFAQVNYGAIATCIGEQWPDGTRALWLFRDKERPLHVIDMRPNLGQIFVTSTASIWREGVEACPAAKQLVHSNMSIIEFPAMFVWLITLNLDGKFDVYKWKINKHRRYDTTFEEQRQNYKSQQSNPKSPSELLVTDLDLDDHEPLQKEAEEPVALLPGPTVKDAPFEDLTKSVVLDKDLKKNGTMLPNTTLPLQVSGNGTHLGGCVNGNGHITTSKINYGPHAVQEARLQIAKQLDTHNDFMKEVDDEDDRREILARHMSVSTAQWHDLKSKVNVLRRTRKDLLEQHNKSDIAQLEKRFSEIESLLEDIRTMSVNLLQEGTMSAQEYEEAIEFLRDMSQQLNSHKFLLENIQCAVT